MAVVSSDRTNSFGSRQRWQQAAILALITVVIDLIIFGIAAAIWDVPGDFSQINVASVIFTPIVSVIIAVIGFSVIARFSSNPLRIFTVLAVIVTILSLSSPITAMTSGMGDSDPVTTSTGITMFVLHVVTGLLIAFGFPALLRRAELDA